MPEHYEWTRKIASMAIVETKRYEDLAADTEYYRRIYNFAARSAPLTNKLLDRIHPPKLLLLLSLTAASRGTNGFNMEKFYEGMEKSYLKNLPNTIYNLAPKEPNETMRNDLTQVAEEVANDNQWIKTKILLDMVQHMCNHAGLPDNYRLSLFSRFARIGIKELRTLRRADLTSEFQERLKNYGLWIIAFLSRC